MFLIPNKELELCAAENYRVGPASHQLARALDKECAGFCAVDLEGELLLDDVVDAGQGGFRGRHHDLMYRAPLIGSPWVV